MRGAKSAKWVAGAVVVALAATACGGSDSGSDKKAKGDGQVSMQISEPQHGLVPSNTYESSGSEVVSALFTGLVSFDEKNEIQLAMAESIETEDNVSWKITLKDGYTFHDGTKVTAESYVDAWTYAANQDNAQETNALFAKIDGYDKLSPGPDKKPTAKELSGLKVIDEKTFEVKLNTPFSAFKSMLGFNAFFPLPKAFFEDPEAFGDKPIGNGPFKMDGKFEHNQQIKTAKYDKHPDADKIEASGVTFKIYANTDTAYKDLQAGNLDIMDTIPTAAMATAKQDLGDRYVEGTASGVGYIGLPVAYNKDFEDQKLRQAISMAIDREAINQAIYSGTRPPADDFINPLVPGYREGACGEACKYDPKKAKALYEESGGLTNDSLEIGYNADGDHKGWITAVANQIEKSLGIKVTAKPFEQFAAILDALGDKKYTGAFRMGWLMDYPNAENYLRPIFSEEAIENGSNYGGYVDEKFEKLLDEADRAPSEEEAVKLYQQADDIILKDLPYIPVYFYQLNAGHSEKLSEMRIGTLEHVEWDSVKLS
ncbi:MAG TPA: phytase [Streptomyces sp.]|nr:phytase [Streptomyces sp.]